MRTTTTFPRRTPDPSESSAAAPPESAPSEQAQPEPTHANARERALFEFMDLMLIWDRNDPTRLAQHVANAVTILRYAPEWRGKIKYRQDEGAYHVEGQHFTERAGRMDGPARSSPFSTLEAPSRHLEASHPTMSDAGVIAARVSCALARTWGLLLTLEETYQAIRLVALSMAGESVRLREQRAATEAAEAARRARWQEQIATGKASRSVLLAEEEACFWEHVNAGGDPKKYVKKHTSEWENPLIECSEERPSPRVPPPLPPR